MLIYIEACDQCPNLTEEKEDGDLVGYCGKKGDLFNNRIGSAGFMAGDSKFKYPHEGTPPYECIRTRDWERLPLGEVMALLAQLVGKQR